MKLATYKDGSRDGQLVVVARDLATAHHTTGIATRLQQVLDDWNFLSPQLQDLYTALNAGKARHAFAFEPRCCMAPLPRAYQRLEATPAAAGLSQAPSDAFFGPRDDWVVPSAPWALDASARVAVIIGDVALASAPRPALEGVRLLMLAQCLSLRPRDATQRDPGSHFAAFSPVAVTPEELGAAWQDGRVHLTLQHTRNGLAVGGGDAETTGHFGELIARGCEMRRLRAGCIVCNQPAGSTGALVAGDTLRVSMTGLDGLSVFGAIEQAVVSIAAPEGPVRRQPGG